MHISNDVAKLVRVVIGENSPITRKMIIFDSQI
jgi:hypothetical protein